MSDRHGRTCRTCRAYDCPNDTRTYGLCRLHPPVIDENGSFWPDVDPDDWCLDYGPVGEQEMQRILDEVKA